MLTTLNYHSTGDEKGYLKYRRVKYAATGEMTTTYNYSKFGAVTKITDPEENATTLDVDDEFLVTKRTSAAPFSYQTVYTYNGNRQPLETWLQNREGTSGPVSGNEWWQTV